MAHHRITATWTGVGGLPGYTRLRFNGNADPAAALQSANRVRTFFDAIKGLLPPAVIISFSEVAQNFSSAGELTSEVTFAPPAAVAATGVGNYAAPVGMVVNWITQAFSRGRKVRGRTFLVPLVSTAFFTDGTPNSTSITTIQTAAAALAAGAPSLIVFSEREATPTTGASTLEAAVSGASVPDRAAVLRSRRD